MFEQTFALWDIPKVATLGFIELLLSADNALVIGLLTFSLPAEKRRKALLIGVFSAFFFRAAALVSASELLRFLWASLLGAAYLIYLSISHFFKKKKDPIHHTSQTYFWKTVLRIELVDLAFAIDSIVAGIAFIGPSPAHIHPKIWIVYVGGMLGLIGTRYAAEMFSSLIDRFPRLETTAHLMVGWIGIELAFNSFRWTFPFHQFIFWSGIAFLFLLGFLQKVRVK